MKRSVIATTQIDSKNYRDAVITKVHEDSYDIQLTNGEIYKFVPNVTSVSFETGDYVSVLFPNPERTECRIIGIGKTLSAVSAIKEVVV